MPLKYERTLTDEEIQILENDIINVKEWIDAAINGKINNCKKRIIKQQLEQIPVDRPDLEVPTTIAGLIKRHFSHSEYKKRKDREHGRPKATVRDSTKPTT